MVTPAIPGFVIVLDTIAVRVAMHHTLNRTPQDTSPKVVVDTDRHFIKIGRAVRSITASMSGSIAIPTGVPLTVPGASIPS